MLKIIVQPQIYSRSYLSILNNYLTGFRKQRLKDRDLRDRPKIFNDKGQRLKVIPLGDFDKAFEVTNISWLIEGENVLTGEKVRLRCGSKFGEDTLRANLPRAVKFI